MGASKEDHFSQRHNAAAKMFRALGHPARVAIVETLLRQKACMCGEIVDRIPLAQPTVSRHLKELKEAGIIQGTIEGPSVCYCIKPEALEKISELLDLWKNKNHANCC